MHDDAVESHSRGEPDGNSTDEGAQLMLVLVIVLLVLWLIASVVGFAFPGLVWLGVVGIILFLGTLAIGIVRRGKGTKA